MTGRLHHRCLPRRNGQFRYGKEVSSVADFFPQVGSDLTTTCLTGDYRANATRGPFTWQRLKAALIWEVAAAISIADKVICNARGLSTCHGLLHMIASVAS